MELQLGYIYKCRWTYRSQPNFMGWDTLMFIKEEKEREDLGRMFTFLDLQSGEKITIDEDLARLCEELNLEEL